MHFIESRVQQIRALCEKYRVKTLYAFGSIVTPQFNDDSDVDLVVDFDVEDPLEYSDNYFNLKFELQKVFNRKVDLLENTAIRNPLLKLQLIVLSCWCMDDQVRRGLRTLR